VAGHRKSRLDLAPGYSTGNRRGIVVQFCPIPASRQSVKLWFGPPLLAETLRYSLILGLNTGPPHSKLASVSERGNQFGFPMRSASTVVLFR
jgi:hypothetical protein